MQRVRHGNILCSRAGGNTYQISFTLYLRQGCCYMLKTSVLSGKRAFGFSPPPAASRAHNGTLRLGVTPSNREERGAGPPALCHSPSLALGSFPPPPPSQPPPTRNPKRLNSTDAPNAARHRFSPPHNTAPGPGHATASLPPALYPHVCPCVPPPTSARQGPARPGGSRSASGRSFPEGEDPPR